MEAEGHGHGRSGEGFSHQNEVVLQSMAQVEIALEKN